MLKSVLAAVMWSQDGTQVVSSHGSDRLSSLSYFGCPILLPFHQCLVFKVSVSSSVLGVVIIELF